MRGRRAAGALGAAASLLLVASCGGNVIEAGDVTVLVADSADDAEGINLGGPLAVVGACAGLGDSVIVWPDGTEVVDEDPLTLDIPDLGEVALGDELEVSGGYAFETTSDPDVDAPAEVAGADIPGDCRGYNLFLVG